MRAAKFVGKTKSKSARARGDVWREYRPAGLHFRIEMPGKPVVETWHNEDEDEGWITAVDADLNYEEITFGVSWTQWKKNQSVAILSNRLRKGMRRAGWPATGERRFTIDGFPAGEAIRRSDGLDSLNYIERNVVMGKETLLITATRVDAGLHASPIVRRFFDSFKLLREAR